VRVIDGMENRVIYVGMDQARDSLLYGKSPDGKNPFKDVRVRRALYQAIDIETIKTKLMNGQSQPTGVLVPSPLAAFNDPEIEKRQRAVAQTKGFELQDHSLSLYAVCTRNPCPHRGK